MSSPNVKLPGPSVEEKALQKEQADTIRFQRELLTEQVRQQELLAPILFKQAGINPIFDDEGKITGFEETEPGLREEIQKESLELTRDILDLQKRELQTSEDLAPAEKVFREKSLDLLSKQLDASERALDLAEKINPLEEEVETLSLERTLAALKGELPINPSLTRELDEQEELLREDLRRQLGPGFETSTPGRNALDKFFRDKEEILEGARRADLTNSESLSLARSSLRKGTTATTTSGSSPFIATNLPSRFGDIFRSSDIAQSRSGSISQFSNVASGFGAITSQLQQDRALQLSANITNATNRSNLFGSIFTGVGSLLGGAARGGLSQGGAFGCWIAEVLYGRSSNAFRAARYWIMFGWEGRMAKVCRWTYLRFGERIAAFLRKQPILQVPARFIFNIAVRKGMECFDG